MPQLQIFRSDNCGHPHEVTDLQIEMIDLVFNTIVDNHLLELPEHVQVVLQEMEGRTLGSTCYDYEEDTLVLMLNPDYSPKDLFTPFCHELCHGEQYKLGWLSSTEDSFVWFGMEFPANGPDDCDTTHEDYVEYPWERCAFREEKVVASAVLKRTGTELVEIFERGKKIWKKPEAQIPSRSRTVN